MNRVLRIDEEKPEMHISVQGYNPTYQPIYCRFTSKKIINSPGYSGRSVR